MIHVAVLGYGTIGSGVVEVLNMNKQVIEKRIGDEVNVKYVLDLRDFPGSPIENILVHDVDVILNDPEVSVVIEVMGGVEPAHTFVKNALLAGKSVATSNKALVAEYGAELLKIAKEKSQSFLFEASVGGGIPIIRSINSALTGDVIEEISGILNGTTNYMMTEMTVNGSEFADVLKDAQAKGYAEADPTADIEGYDACRKIAILTSLVAGQQVDFEDIYTEGITKITANDIKFANAMGRSIKLLATSKKQGDSYVAMVAPVLLAKDHPLYNVNGVFNAVFVVGNMLGDAMFYGSGAGSLPTASAVVADVVDICKNLGKNIPCEWKEEKLKLADISSSAKSFFVRIEGTKEEKAEEIKNAFANVEFVECPEVENECGFVTELMSEKDFEENAAKLSGMKNRIRMD